MTDFDPLQLALLAHGRMREFVGAIVVGGLLIAGGLWLIGSTFLRKRGGASHGGGSIGTAVGFVLAALGYGILGRGVGLPGWDVALQLAGWIVAIGGLMLPGLLRRWQATAPDMETIPDAEQELAAEGALRRDSFEGEPEERLARIIEKGETILWIGRPERRRFIVDGVVLGVFGLVPLAFGVGIAYGIVERMNRLGLEWPYLVGQVLGLELAVLLFCFGGMLCVSPWMMPRQLGKVLYAVTDRRGLVSAPPYSIWSPVPMRSKRSRFPAAGEPMEFSPAELRDGLRKRKWFGASDLVFVAVTIGNGKQRQRIEYGFLGLADAAAAQAAIKTAFPRPEAEREA